MQPTTPVPFTPEMEAAYARAKAPIDRVMALLLLALGGRLVVSVLAG
jgi:hypothetical protein